MIQTNSTCLPSISSTFKSELTWDFLSFPPFPKVSLSSLFYSKVAGNATGVGRQHLSPSLAKRSQPVGVDFLSLTPADPHGQLFRRVLVPLSWKPRVNLAILESTECCDYLEIFLLVKGWVSLQSQRVILWPVFLKLQGMEVSLWGCHKASSLLLCAMQKGPCLLPTVLSSGATFFAVETFAKWSHEFCTCCSWPAKQKPIKFSSSAENLIDQGCKGTEGESWARQSSS